VRFPGEDDDVGERAKVKLTSFMSCEANGAPFLSRDTVCPVEIPLTLANWLF
jgi:hypothetical protein